MAENAANTPRRGFWSNFFNKTMNPEQQALLGTLSFFATIVAVAYIAINEPNRMDTFTSQYDARSIQRGAALYQGNCATCHGPDGLGIPNRAPALNSEDLFDGTRLQNYGYAGTVADYVELTIAGGRPKKTDPQWENPMPTWSQEYGGPMRPDQVRDVRNFVLNWGCSYDEDCIPAEEADVVLIATGIPPGTPMPTATRDPNAPAPVCDAEDPAGEREDCLPFEDLPEGDAANGEALFNNEVQDLTGALLACQSCHTVEAIAPLLPGIENFPDEYGSVEEYAYHSILHPDEFVQEGYPSPSAMPKSFGLRLSPQMLADLIAYVTGE